MDVAAEFVSLAYRDLPFLEFAWEFCGLAAAATALEDATINSLFWIWANYHRPVDLPDTTGLSWREGILRCLERVQPRSRTSPPSSPSAIPQPSLSVAARSSPPPFTGKLTPPSAAFPSLPSAGKTTPPFTALQARRRPRGTPRRCSRLFQARRRSRRKQTCCPRLSQARRPWGN